MALESVLKGRVGSLDRWTFCFQRNPLRNCLSYLISGNFFIGFSRLEKAMETNEIILLYRAKIR